MCGDLGANPSAPDHGVAQMDAKVHPARPVHRNAEEMIGLVRRDRRRQRADESADQVADHHPDAAARRNFQELSPAQGRGFHLSA